MRSMPKKLVSSWRRALSSLSGGEKAAELADAGVVDDERHVAGARRGRGDLVGLGHVEPDRLDAGQGDGRRVARTGVDLARAAGQQRAREREADAAVGAGDEDDGVVDLHGESPVRVETEYDARHIRGRVRGNDGVVGSALSAAAVRVCRTAG